MSGSKTEATLICITRQCCDRPRLYYLDMTKNPDDDVSSRPRSFPVFSRVVKAVITIVVSTIQAFSNIVAIVNRGCLVLHNIALDPGHFTALVAMGAPEELMHAIDKHPSDALLCQSARGTLRRLGMSEVLNDRAGILAGALGVVQAV